MLRPGMSRAVTSSGCRQLRERFGEIEVPGRLRAMVRACESSLIMFGAPAGALAGVVTALMSYRVDLLHSLLFDLPLNQSLSGLPSIDPIHALAVPAIGSIMFGAALAFVTQRRPNREVDAIEANALYGGQMSLTGSLIVAAQTVCRAASGHRAVSRPATARLPAA